MDRRTFFGATVGGLLCSGLSLEAGQRTSAYGLMDVDGWLRHKALTGEKLHVFLNGEDVTRRCFFSDDTIGEVHLFKHDMTGQKYLDIDGPAREVLRGHVVMRPGD